MSLNALSAKSQEALHSAIEQFGLISGAALLRSHAVECATLLIAESEDYAQVGNSRYGGLPDLPEGTEWPRNGEGKAANFLMQINFADVPPFAGTPFPRKGLLTLFWSDWSEIRAFYSDMETMTVKRAEKPGEEFFNRYLNELKPYRLAIETAVDLPAWYSTTSGAIIETLLEYNADADEDDLFESYEDMAGGLLGTGWERWAGKLWGHPRWIGHDPGWLDPAWENNAPKGWVLLALINSKRTVDAMFGDAGYLQLFIHRDALAACDFSNIVADLESS